MTTSTEWAWPMVFIWTLVVAPFWIFWIFFGSEKSKMKYNLPPGPPGWPVVGNIFQLLDPKENPYQITSKMAETYGPIMLFKVGIKNMVFVNSPKMALEILKVQDHIFGNRPLTSTSGVKKYLFYGDYDLILSQLGGYHTTFRKLVTTELLGQTKLPEFEAIRTAELDIIINDVFSAFSSAPKEQINLHDLFNGMTMNVITRMAFGRKFFGLTGADAKSNTYMQFKYGIGEMIRLFPSVLAEDAFPALKWVDLLTGTRRKMQACFRLMDTLLQNLIDEHRQHLNDLSLREVEEYKPKDFMDILLLSNKKAKVGSISDLSIKAIAEDLIAAGTETSALTLEWVMSELLVHPDIMKKAQNEVDSVVGKDRRVHESDMPDLPYLAAVIKECFRLHPPLPWLLPRSNNVDCKVGGYDIPAGSIINVNVYRIGRDPSLWENPLIFDPDRFLTGNLVNVDYKGQHAQLIPFGGGRRLCIGLPMSKLVISTALARMIHSFDWSLPEETAPHELDMSETYGGTASRKTNLRAIPKPRLPRHLYNH